MRTKGHAKPINGVVAHPLRPSEFISYSHDCSFIVWQLESDQPTTQDPLSSMEKGVVIMDQYTLEERIGHGRACVVWKCLDQDSEEHVALKVYLDEVSFLRESRFVRMFQHPRILRYKDCYGVGQVDDWPEYCMATFPLGQESLQDMHIRRRQGLDVTQVRFIVFDILDALKALQVSGVVHCDLKPANIISITTQGDVFPHFMLINFDAACMVDEPVTHGTVDYCAPEQEKDVPATLAMDLFSLGRIIHWLSSMDKNIWPDLDSHPTDEDKSAFLQSSQEFSRDNIQDASTKRIVRNLTCKDPAKRYTLQQVKTSNFMTGSTPTTLF
jgi:serine/threonine protein kinase